MNYQTAPHLASQHDDLLSVSSETIPLYHLLPIKEEAALDQSCCHGDGSELISLSGLLEAAFDIQAENATTNTTFNHGNDGSSFSVTQGCPDNCPCVCHVPAPCTSFNQRRPSVIMTPVARRRKAASESCTHAPLKVRTGTLGSLINSVLERRNSTGSGLFASLGSGLVQTLGQIVLIREKKLSNTNLLA